MQPPSAAFCPAAPQPVSFLFSCAAVNPFDPLSGHTAHEVGWPACICLPVPHWELFVCWGTRAHLHRAHTGRLFPPNILTSYFPSADILQPLQTPRLGHWLSLVATSYRHCWVHSKLTAHTMVPSQLPKKNKVLVENRAACPQFRRHTWERRQPCHLQFNLKFPQLVPSVPLFYRKPQSSLWGNPTAEVRVKRCNVLTIPLLIAVSDFKGTEHWNRTKGSKGQCAWAQIS